MQLFIHLFPCLFKYICSKTPDTHVSCAADNDKSNEDRQKEEELLQQIHKLVETRDFLVDDVEFERLRCVFLPLWFNYSSAGVLWCLSL